ncbi:NAD(P)/FAD-dependent oxidoreductase [Gordonia sp. PP30]|uniref:flavin-containing monooxygenase n=1 Tax=unclassified Gordonia (in: high G+C Gram-positive bacteria) TaxID=2657482 RepID=UPI001FFF2BB3|nr:NAD(P)/FAD-dependent oxidoreductase [Gordonia sp. PP30]UQE76660.1 NAD(P)/FAD-dependent oxidoreductase [Gordonia sp. PP30]
MTVTDTRPDTESGETTKTLDALVIGAGVAGLYQVYQLKKLGLNVHGYEEASDVGGTWYWNRYPGARFDSEGYIYQYMFDEDLYKGWSWSKKFPDQSEIEDWFHYATDKLGVRDDFDFSTRITSAEFDEVTGRWTVTTDRGQIIDTRFLVSCAGMLSAPLTSMFEGQDTFLGEIFHTSRWPRDGVQLLNKRVAVIGTGATGIQVIQTIAPDVELLKVFVRTPQFTLPMKNPDYTTADVRAYHDKFEHLRDTVKTTVVGFEYDYTTKEWAERTEEERRELLEECYNDGSLKLWIASYLSMFVDPDVSAAVSDFVRAKIGARLRDPKLIDLLVPKPEDFGFGTHRVPLERGYYEVFHRPNVEAIGVRNNPITRIVPEGIELADGTLHEVDVIIMATGFDAGSGALSRLDPKGRGGRSLADDWNREIRSTMGFMVHGYPNLLTTGIPLAPSAALCNMPTCLQQQTEWISRLIGHMQENGHRVVEPTLEGEEAWVQHHDEVTQATLIAKTDSWYNGANVEGKPRGRVLSYLGAADFRQRTDENADRGYPGFRFA